MQATPEPGCVYLQGALQLQLGSGRCLLLTLPDPGVYANDPVSQTLARLITNKCRQYVNALWRVSSDLARLPR